MNDQSKAYIDHCIKHIEYYRSELVQALRLLQKSADIDCKCPTCQEVDKREREAYTQRILQVI